VGAQAVERIGCKPTPGDARPKVIPSAAFRAELQRSSTGAAAAEKGAAQSVSLFQTTLRFRSVPLHVRAVSPSPVRVKDSRRELGRQIQFHEPGVARGNTPNKRFWRAAFATFLYRS